MAGDWMKIELDLPDKPEVHYIAGVINKDPEWVVGALIKVWAWFNKHTTDGNATGVTLALVDRYTNVVGFGEAMMLAGWLEQHGSVLCMPKFDRHTSESAKTRALGKNRQSRLRNAKVTQAALPREEKRRVLNTPITPKGANAVSISTFLEACKQSGEKPIPENDPVFEYAEKVGIPLEYLRLCWREFVDRNKESGKRYKDWRKTYRNCVRSNWYKIWFISPNGEVGLTTQGMAASKTHKEAA